MNISELSLKRPVLATVMNLMLILFGVVGYTFLSVRDYPAIDTPIIGVNTSYTGANADIIESQITEPLEKQINGIPGIRTITSSSSLGNSQITVEFNLGVDLEAAASDVRDKVSQAARSLPQDIDAAPVLTKSDANSDFILILAVQSRTKSLLELSDYAENVLQQQLQTINQVSSVNIFGQKRYAMRIWIDPDKLNAYGIAFNDVGTALNSENVELPPGKISGNNTELTIKALGRLTSENDFRNLIIREDSAGIVRLRDVAQIELGPEVLDQSWKYNGVNAVGLAIIPQPGANNIQIANEFYKRLAEIERSNKSDIQLNVLIDNTRIIRQSISDVEETLAIAFGLVVLVIFLFFRNWLIALRPLIDIPISLVATFFIMYLAGFSINILTLLGIVLGTGLVVDDGIVVTENIFRKLEHGLPIRKAALEGSREIFFAVISTSTTLAIVFLPVIFLQGFVGRLFREFGVVLASAVCGFTIWLALKNLQSEIAPLEDRSSIRFTVTAPEGTSYAYTQKIADDITNYLYDSVPERDFVFARTPAGGAANTSQPRIGLIAPKLRARSQDEITNDLQQKLNRYNDARIFAVQEQTIAVGSGSRIGLPVQFILQNQDLKKLEEVIPKFLDEARKDKTFSNVDVNLKFNRPELQVTVDRMKVKDLGLSTSDVLATMQAAFSGGRLAYFIMRGYQYQVIAQVERIDRNKPFDIEKLYVKNNLGENIPLDAVVHIQESSNPATLFHFNRYKAATISASLP